MDERMMPYAQFLEDFVQLLVESQPKKVFLGAILPDGNVVTGYFGANTQDKAIMAHHINMDAVMDTVYANAKTIVQVAEEQEG